MMAKHVRNPVLQNEILPVDIVLHPSWWYTHAGITFDEDFFYNPARRVEAERKMAQVLYDRFGEYGLGAGHSQDLPIVGAVHNAAGYLVSEMLGCEVDYIENAAPQVIVADVDSLSVDVDRAFHSMAFKRFEKLAEELKTKYGYLTGDVNWAGILNVALDLRGQKIFMDLFDKPEEVREFSARIAQTIDRFTSGIKCETGTTSISVNRNVRHLKGPVFLHSECSHTMISEAHYEEFLLPFDVAWSQKHRPFGIHYCGSDPHRYAEVFAKLPHLDFLDVGWGGDVRKLREFLPRTFLNIRLDPVSIVNQSVEEICSTMTRLVQDSDNPYLTGVCCINMDDKVGDDKIAAILETAVELRRQYATEA
jgi:hypothetical protein